MYTYILRKIAAERKVVKMGRLTCWTCLVILAVSWSQLQIAGACSCALEHPQTQFCNSDFVAVIRVKRRASVNEHEIAYKVKVRRTFKASPSAEIALDRKPLWLWSSATENVCGRVNLTPGTTWVVSGRMIGGKPSISLCTLAMLWSEVTPRQRKGFRKFYSRGCTCRISYTDWSKKGAVLETAGGKSCLWESSPGPQDCQERYGICMVGPAGCYWTPAGAYKKCIMQYQRERVQHRGREP